MPYCECCGNWTDESHVLCETCREALRDKHPLRVQRRKRPIRTAKKDSTSLGKITLGSIKPAGSTLDHHFYYRKLKKSTTRFRLHTRTQKKYANRLEQQLEQKPKTRHIKRHNIVSDKPIFPEWKR